MVQGPNGFFRHFKGTATGADITVQCDYVRHGLFRKKVNGDLEVIIQNHSSATQQLLLKDHAYGMEPQEVTVKPDAKKHITIKLEGSKHWYDFSVVLKDDPSFEWHYAGHVETGKESITDPQMAGN